jgi:osmotically-inducible protein OsmY
MKSGLFVTFVTALAIALSSSVLAQSGAAPDRRDVRLADDIGRSLESYTRLTIFDDVGARVDHGVVTLVGKVTAPIKSNDLERRIARIDGVRELRNHISVLPVSPYDDDLRYRVARAIYGNPAFWRYASMANPPIRIVVENSRVTLTGVVTSEVERVLAQSLATGLGELSVTNELRTEAKGNFS